MAGGKRVVGASGVEERLPPSCLVEEPAKLVGRLLGLGGAKSFATRVRGIARMGR